MIPTYNQAHLVLDAVDSALGQNYPNLEVIIADDASTDDTAGVVATRHDPRLRYCRNEINLGRVGNYRNTLYNLASGEWVVNLDGDDYFTDNAFISTAIKLALTDPKILAVMAIAQVEEARLRKQVSEGGSADIMEGMEALIQIAREQRHFFHLATLYRRQEAIATDFYRVASIDSDFESVGRLMLRGRVGFLNREVGVWRKHRSNISEMANWEELLDRLDSLTNLFDMAIASGLPRKRAQPALNSLITALAYLDLLRLLASGKCAAARRYLTKFVGRFGPRSAAVLGIRWRLYATFLRRCVLGARQ